MISLTTVRTALVLLAGVFFSLFFGFELPIAGFRVELNTIAVLLLASIVPMRFISVIQDKFITFWILSPFAIIAFLYGAVSLLMNSRVSFMPFMAQMPFLFAAIGLGFELSDWVRSRQVFKIYAFNYIVLISFFVGLIANSSFNDVATLVRHTVELEASGLVTSARRTFNVNDFVKEDQIGTLANNHNRISQHTFALSFFCLSTLALAMKVSPQHRLFGIGALPASLFILLFSLVLLSGQSLGQLLLTVSFCLFVHIFIVVSKNSLFWGITAVVGVNVLALIFAGTEYGQHWMNRLSSDNVSTGRVDRWLYYWGEIADVTVLGSDHSLPIDPHNIVVSLLFEIGPLGLIFFAALAIACVIRPFVNLKSGALRYGIGYTASMSVGLQIVFVAMIAGGYGFPGWAEFSKFSIFVLAHRLTRMPYFETEGNS